MLNPVGPTASNHVAKILTPGPITSGFKIYGVTVLGALELNPATMGEGRTFNTVPPKVSRAVRLRSNLKYFLIKSLLCTPPLHLVISDCQPALPHRLQPCSRVSSQPYLCRVQPLLSPHVSSPFYRTQTLSHEPNLVQVNSVNTSYSVCFSNKPNQLVYSPFLVHYIETHRWTGFVPECNMSKWTRSKVGPFVLGCTRNKKTLSNCRKGSKCDGISKIWIRPTIDREWKNINTIFYSPIQTHEDIRTKAHSVPTYFIHCNAWVAISRAVPFA